LGHEKCEVEKREISPSKGQRAESELVAGLYD